MAMIAEMTEEISPRGCAFPCRVTTRLNKSSPLASLRSRSPLPGQPFGNVEKRRCRRTSSLSPDLNKFSHQLKRQKGESGHTPFE
jgi:hypothetical protein